MPIWIIVGIVVLVLVILGIIGSSKGVYSTQQGAGNSASVGKGSLSAGRETVAYFGDGIVYDRNMVNIGAYKLNTERAGAYDIIFENKNVGSYTIRENSESLIMWNGINPWDMEVVGKIYSEGSIIPEKDNYEVMLYRGDPIGASAAYVILCYEFPRCGVSNYAQYFVK